VAGRWQWQSGRQVAVDGWQSGGRQVAVAGLVAVVAVAGAAEWWQWQSGNRGGRQVVVAEWHTVAKRWQTVWQQVAGVAE
jgi:hypothetical protein